MRAKRRNSAAFGAIALLIGVAIGRYAFPSTVAVLRQQVADTRQDVDDILKGRR